MTKKSNDTSDLGDGMYYPYPKKEDMPYKSYNDPFIYGSGAGLNYLNNYTQDRFPKASWGFGPGMGGK